MKEIKTGIVSDSNEKIDITFPAIGKSTLSGMLFID
jgi:hypothetical protein